MRQFLILILVIVFGMIISVSVNAQSGYKKCNARFYKSKYKAQINQYANACNLLEHKRTHKPKVNNRLATLTKPKYKPLAEINSPTNMQHYAKSKHLQMKTKSTVIAMETKALESEKLSLDNQ